MKLPTRQEFLNTPAGSDAKQELKAMVKNPTYDTSGSTSLRTNGGMSFVERHLDYLVRHPYLSPTTYISNLKIMIKTKR